MYIYISTWWTMKLHFQVGWSKLKFRNLIETIQVSDMALHFPNSIGNLSWRFIGYLPQFQTLQGEYPNYRPDMWRMWDDQLQGRKLMWTLDGASENGTRPIYMASRKMGIWWTKGFTIYLNDHRLPGRVILLSQLDSQMGQESGLSFEELILMYVRSLRSTRNPRNPRLPLSGMEKRWKKDDSRVPGWGI